MWRAEISHINCTENPGTYCAQMRQAEGDGYISQFPDFISQSVFGSCLIKIFSSCKWCLNNNFFKFKKTFLELSFIKLKL